MNPFSRKRTRNGVNTIPRINLYQKHDLLLKTTSRTDLPIRPVLILRKNGSGDPSYLFSPFPGIIPRARRMFLDEADQTWAGSDISTKKNAQILS